MRAFRRLISRRMDVGTRARIHFESARLLAKEISPPCTGAARK